MVFISEHTKIDTRPAENRRGLREERERERESEREREKEKGRRARPSSIGAEGWSSPTLSPLAARQNTTPHVSVCVFHAVAVDTDAI